MALRNASDAMREQMKRQDAPREVAPASPTTGELLKRQRERHGWSVHDAAARAGVPYSTVLSVESGSTGRWQTARAVAYAYGKRLSAVAVRDRKMSVKQIADAAGICHNTATVVLQLIGNPAIDTLDPMIASVDSVIAVLGGKVTLR